MDMALQHTVTYCNIMPRTATYYNTRLTADLLHGHGHGVFVLLAVIRCEIGRSRIGLADHLVEILRSQNWPIQDQYKMTLKSVLSKIWEGWCCVGLAYHLVKFQKSELIIKNDYRPDFSGILWEVRFRVGVTEQRVEFIKCHLSFYTYTYVYKVLVLYIYIYMIYIYIYIYILYIYI